MNGPRFATAPILVKRTLTTANANRNGTGTLETLYTVPATYDFAPPPAFASGLGTYTVPNANQTARGQGLRVARIRAIATGISGDGVLCIYTGTDLYDQIKINAITTVTAGVLTWKDVLDFETTGGWQVPAGTVIAVSATVVSSPIVVTLEGGMG